MIFPRELCLNILITVLVFMLCQNLVTCVIFCNVNFYISENKNKDLNKKFETRFPASER